MTEEKFIDTVKNLAHAELNIVDIGSSTHPDYIIVGVDLLAKRLVKLLPMQFVSGSAFREHCDFKDAPCNYTGKGWYDRCAWCKDNNGFRRKIDDSSKPF